jgi:photosystem II stability/assembly factor-like uncharacterized protein
MTTEIAEATVQRVSTEPSELLIKEAREIQERHHRRRWIIALAVLVLIVAVVVAAGGGRTPSRKPVVNSSRSPRSGPTGNYDASIPVRSQVPQLVVRAGTSNVLYVLYSAMCDGKQCYRLTRSANGGQTFAKVTTPPINNEYTDAGAGTGSLDQLVFANAEDGYATENFWGKQSKLYATFDGGRTWHREHIKGAQFIQSLTKSPTDFYVITEHCDPRHITCTDLQLARSPLQRSEWTSSPVPENVLRGVRPSFGLQLAAYGAKTWILEQTELPPQRLAISTNGGKSFSIRPEPELTGAATCQLTATSTTSLWANCAQGNQFSELSYSADGGEHWTASSMEVTVTSDKSKGTVRLLSFGSFDPVAGDVAYATDGVETPPGQAIYQLAAGRSGAFRVVGSLPTSNYFYFLTFTNSKQGLAYAFVGQGAKNPLWSTDNGGKSWTKIPVPTK